MPLVPTFPFESLLSAVRHNGEPRTDRTGTGTLSVFGPNPLRFDLEGGRVPLITSKAVPWKMALREFMWMLSGSTNVNDLRKSSPAMASIWDNWADKFGSIGPSYGAQYRNAGGSFEHIEEVGMDEWATKEVGVDQLARVVAMLAKTPNTRRALISLWSAPELDAMQLEPCMVTFQFSLRGPDLNRLQLHIYQRSADLMLGVPFDLFQGGVLTHLVARELMILTGRPIYADKLIWSAGDAHIYSNQLASVDTQLAQWSNAEPMNAKLRVDPFPSLRLLDGTLEPGHISVLDYNPQPAVSAPIAI